MLETKLGPTLYEKDSAIDDTLVGLGADYVDVMLLHHPANNCLYAWDMPEKASKEGRIRAIGLSGFRTDQIQEVTDKGEIRTMIMKWNSGKPLERNLFCRRFAYTLRFHKKCSVTAIKEGRP